MHPKNFLINRQQGFGVLSVALASHALTLMGALLEDVSVEAGTEQTTPPEPLSLNILDTGSALDRVCTFFQAVPLNNVLFYLATVSYRKVIISFEYIRKH